MEPAPHTVSPRCEPVGETMKGLRCGGMPTIYVIALVRPSSIPASNANETAEQRRQTLIEGYLTEQGK